MFFAKVYVTYKESILDPKGEAIRKAIHQLDYQAVQSVRMGKYFEVQIDASTIEEAEKIVNEISSKLLINEVMETYRYDLEEVK